MLEWMHDAEISSCFEKNFSSMSLLDCTEFIRQSWSDDKNLHLAAVDQYDEYMGTVSLKNIHEQNGWAEFAISMRRNAMGTGMAHSAMEDVIHVGKERYNLTHIYWNVLKSNARAIRFYEKNGFKKADESELNVILNICHIDGWGGVGIREFLIRRYWYCISI